MTICWLRARTYRTQTEACIRHPCGTKHYAFVTQNDFSGYNKVRPRAQYYESTVGFDIRVERSITRIKNGNDGQTKTMRRFAQQQAIISCARFFFNSRPSTHLLQANNGR